MGPDPRAVSYVNGRFVKGRAACISILDRGFLLGDALFETLRIAEGRPLFLREHVERMADSARCLGIPFHPGEKEIRRILQTLCRRNRLGNAAARIVVSRGVYTGSLVPAGRVKPTLVMFIWKFDGYPRLLYQRGVDLVSTQVPVFSPAVKGMRVKSINYLNNILAYAQAAARGAHEAIMVSARGEPAEGSTSNLFLVRGQRLLTPSEDSGILPGISRETAIRLARQLKLRVTTCRFRPDMLHKADEAFLTSSLRGILPVRSIDGKRMVGAVPGTVTKTLMDAYARLIEQKETT